MSRRNPAPRRAGGGWRRPAWLTRLKPRLVLAVSLGLVLLAELLPGPGGGSGLSDPPLPRPSGAVPGMDKAGMDKAGMDMTGMDMAGMSAMETEVAGWTRTILARPLFTPGRRPPTVAASGGDGLPRLSAIIVGQGMASAIFAADGQKPLVVQPGGLVAGNKVQSISAEVVVLSTAGGLVALRPRFAGGAPAATRLNFPAATRLNFPAATRLNFPAATRLNFPAATRLNFPAATRLNFPAATRLGLSAGPRSPLTGQPMDSAVTAGPYDNE